MEYNTSAEVTKLSSVISADTTNGLSEFGQGVDFLIFPIVGEEAPLV